MGREERVNAPIVRVLEPSEYWHLRAVLGDVDRARAAVLAAQQQLAQLQAVQAPLVQQVAGDGVDINFLTHIDWNDTTFEVTLRRG